MDDVDKLLKNTVDELDRLLNAKNVLGEPIEKGGATIIPMVSFGFGFGAGGSDNSKRGKAAGTGAGGGIRPVGAIIVDERGVRVERLHGAMHSLADTLGEVAAKAMEGKAKGKEKGKAAKETKEAEKE